MKLKYYLRGLGIGILFTAILFIVIINPQKKMTDDQIKEAAIKLGMVEAEEDSSLSDLLHSTPKPEQSTLWTEQDTTASSFPAVTNEPSDAASLTTQPEDKSESNKMTTEPDATEPTTAATEPVTTKPVTTEPATTETIPTGPVLVRVKIESGMNSETFASLLFEKGLVDDEELFNQYLVRKGYSYSLIIGTYEIPMGSTHEEIAKIVTGR